MFRKKLLTLREEIDSYKVKLNKDLIGIKLSKANFEDEVNYQFDFLNYCPQETQIRDAYLQILNSRIQHPCDVPIAKKVFECSADAMLEDKGEVSTDYQELHLKPQQNLVYSINDRLPQPMKIILNQQQQETQLITGQAKVLCVAYKLQQGESKLVEWTIYTGQKRQKDFDMTQPSEFEWQMPSQGDKSLPWEQGSQWSNNGEEQNN